MPDLSLPAAVFLNNVGNLGLGLGALLVLTGTILAIWTGGIKERYADQRISANEAQTATAKSAAATADSAAASANERAAALERDAAEARAREAEANRHIAEANASAEVAKADAAAANERASQAGLLAANAALDVERLKRGRQLTQENHTSFQAAMSRYPGTVFDVAIPGQDPEARALMQDVTMSLITAGWKKVDWSSSEDGSIQTGRPIGNVDCVGIVINVNIDDPKLKQISGELRDELQSFGLLTALVDNSLTMIVLPVIHIAFGRKPPVP